MPKVLSLAWETILEIELAFEDKHCQPGVIQELFRRLHNDVQNIHEELAVYINTPSWDRPTVCYDDDDDEDYANVVTPNLSTEEPDNSLSMRDEHIDTVLAIESDEFIKSSVEYLILIPSESEGIPDNMCDVPFHDNSPPLDISKYQFEDFSDSNNDSTSNDDDSFSIDNIEYVKASPPDSELVSSKTIREKLLNINLLIANIEALKYNPTPSSDFMTKSSSTSLNSLLEKTNTFNYSLPKLETFCFDLEENSSGSTTTRFDISLPEYEAFYEDHVKEISSGSTTTHSNCSLYDSFIFDLSINPFPPADRNDFYEFPDELTHIISPPEYDCFYFKNEPNSGDFTIDVVEDTFLTREPRVHDHNVLPTHPPFQLNMDFILSRLLFAFKSDKVSKLTAKATFIGCALLRQELEENLVAHSLDFQNTSEPSNVSTNVVNAPREPYVVEQDNRSFVDKIIFRAPDAPDQFHCFHCKDVLRAGEACKRCTCAKCESGLGKGLCYICGHNQNSLNDSPSIFETSSQSPPNINHCCYECGDPLDGIFCKRCTCKSCGKDAHIGYNCPSKVLVISNPEPCDNQTIDEFSQTLPIFHPTFHSEAESPFTLYSTPTYVDESPNVFNPPPQPSVVTIKTLISRKNFKMSHNNILVVMIAGLLMTLTNKLEEKKIEEERAAKVKYWKLPICYDDDDDEERPDSLNDNIISGLPPFSAITLDEPVLSTEEPDNSLKFSSIDDDSFSIDDNDYVEASPLDSELVNPEVMEIVIPEVGGIDDDILLTIEHDVL
nr:hypothetical protein [Tanacetum cinerariifolium]